MAWMLIEKLKRKKPQTAREFAGFPIEYEMKQVSVDTKATSDDRIMADGRPAFTWWNEIQMLRAREPELQKAEARLLEKMTILCIAEWATAQDCLTGDILIRYKRDLLISESNPQMAVLNDPGKFCEVIKAPIRPA